VESVSPPAFQTEAGPTSEAPFPIFTIPVQSDDAVRSLGEKAKVDLFGLVGKRTLVGKKPEEYIALDSIVWKNKVYVRVRGIYSSTYFIDAVFPLKVGERTVEVEFSKDFKISAENGTASLKARLRNSIRIENVSYFDDRAEEVQIELPPKKELKRLRTVHSPLTVDGVQKLLDASLEWAKKNLRSQLDKVVAAKTTVEGEGFDVSDHEVILVPFCTLTYLNAKTSEKKGLVYDSLNQTMRPSSVAQG